jgi:hypothetical protein
MADFLTNLAMRAARPLDAVRPRLPSMFEPLRLDLLGQKTSGELFADDAPQDRAAPEEFVATAGPWWRQHMREPQTDQSGVTDAAAQANARTTRAGLAQDREPATPTKPHRADEATVPNSSHAHSEDAMSHEAEPLAIAQRGSRASERVVESRVEPQAMRRSFDEDATSSSRRAQFGEQDTAEPPKPIVGRRIARATGDDRAGPAPSNGLIPAKTSADHDLRTGIESASGPAERGGEPVIHVSIGRVEVRAVSAPQRSSAKEQAPSRVMSLEDYLRTRAR